MLPIAHVTTPSTYQPDLAIEKVNTTPRTSQSAGSISL